MKCQHCGIHFDDEERVCPMCGARAGSKGRMTRPAPKWHGKPRETYTEYHPTIENSSSAKTAKSKSRPIKDKPKKNRAKGAVIAVIVIALLQFVPTLIAFVVDDLVPEIESSFGNASAPDYGSDYSYAAQDLSSILGMDSGMVIDNSDTFRLHYDQSNDEWAILYTSADGGTFKSTASAWCLYDDPNEYYYPEAYPSDQYDMYTVAFTLYDTEAAGSLPDWCQSIADSGDDIWLNFYVSKTDDTLLIEDMDGIGLFGTTDPVPYYRAQNM